ncbi:MarR family transcriptional regulator [Caballeronia arationis]|jgi:DNA-binding MarR family transcriptional regulator|uniref:DNA-binding transcriptional regulator, MarR family n=1 Tax=Caballeronia arationis TaxID=1777142 RepID=A0A7Z7I4Z9_9BURK|nr:MarR family winged helix-turn-helix transcriptional regulator [Caballeronia arationis]SAK75694.1 MarR family transcriptional regulator [Caballeronia arationis]SOE63115.1 DNA-binding transcriptional regulator, MarR family [Caballeronia arationis]
MFDQCLYFNTTALARALEREWTKAFKPFGLTPSQGFMLRAILDKPGLLQSELAAGLAISRPTATRSLDGLQKLTLIERWSTDRDGRESAIHPTALGESMKDDLNAVSADVTKRLRKKLGAAHFEDSVSKLKNIRSLID